MAGHAGAREDPDELTEDGHRLLDEYAETGDEAALRAATAAYERGLELLPPGEQDWPFLSNLGNCLRLVYEDLGVREALDRALEVLEQAAGQVPADDEDQAIVLDNLALALRDRFAATGRGADLRRAVELHGAAADACPHGPERCRYLNNLGGALSELYDHTGDLEYLERATAFFEAAVDTTPDGSPELSRHLSNLATAVQHRYQAAPDAALLDRAVDLARAALDVPGADVTDRGRMLSGLADVLLERFEATDRLDALNEAVQLLRTAATGAAPDSRAYAGRLSNLGQALLMRFERTSADADLDESVRLLEQAVSLVAGEPDGPGWFLSGLAGALGARYVLRGSRTDLDRAIELSEAAVGAIPAEARAAAFAARRLDNLGMLLRKRYQADGDLADLQAAARRFGEAADATPPGSSAMAQRQVSVGLALRDVYARTGEVSLLEDAIGRYREALAAAGPDLPVRAICLDNLGMALLDRYELSGRLEDLDQAVDLMRMAVAATPDDAAALAGVLSNLGVALWSRHTRRPAGGDLDEALDAFRQAVERTAPGAPDAAIYLDNLASARGDQYQLTGDPRDLDRAISTCEQALAVLPENAAERLRIRTNLAVNLLTRYREARAAGEPDEQDLNRALDHVVQAAGQTPPGTPALVSRLNTLGVGLKYRFQRDQDPADLDRGRAALAAAGGPQGVRDVWWSLAAATTLAGWDGERGDWPEAAAAYRTAMATAESYLRVQLARDSTEAAMRGVGGLYADAAHALSRAGQAAGAATAAERGRAFLLSMALDRERGLAALLATAGSAELTGLAERFRLAAERVRQLTGLSRPQSPAGRRAG